MKAILTNLNLKPVTHTRKIFPIKTATACQLKWAWSTVYLTTGSTASCHRVNHQPLDPNNFDFHNTEQKLKDRQRMLEGLWPEQGCEYCRNIELAGGASDRITNLDFWSFDQPKELLANPSAVKVTPKIVEIYFNNTCNLKCSYCGPKFSSLWNDELRRYNDPRYFEIDSNFELNKQNCFTWLQDNATELHQLNVLGGEPLYQEEFDQLLDILEQQANPDLTLTFFSNLAVAHDKLREKIDRIEGMLQQGKIKRLMLTASLDCWGEEQEFARFPLNLTTWEKNFNYILAKDWITVTIGSTITPLTIKTLHVLMAKINEWNKIRPIYWYGNSVNNPEYHIDMFGNVFGEDFDRAIELMPTQFPEHRSVRDYLIGIKNQAGNTAPDLTKIEKLYIILEQMDARRGTNWRGIYPWLVTLFQQHIGKR